MKCCGRHTAALLSMRPVLPFQPSSQHVQAYLVALIAFHEANLALPALCASTTEKTLQAPIPDLGFCGWPCATFSPDAGRCEALCCTCATRAPEYKLPMKSEPPTPTRAPDNQFRQM